MGEPGLLRNVDDAFTFGFDAAGAWGPITIQGEYIRAHMLRDAGLENVSFHGGYAQIAWMLTGESRRYSHHWLYHRRRRTSACVHRVAVPN